MNMNPTRFEIHEEMRRIMDWTMEAAEQHVDLARFNDEPVDPEVCMGLRQSFEAEFSFDQLKAWGLLEEAMNLWGHTFAKTVKMLDRLLPKKSDMGG